MEPELFSLYLSLKVRGFQSLSVSMFVQHTNYSTKSMRSEGGYDVILKAVQKLAQKHDEHMTVYGKDNKQRLTGKHETASWESFKCGVADRGASVRIPRQTEMEKKGYFEDRRPAANCDPYLVTATIAKTTLLDAIYPKDEASPDSMESVEAVTEFQTVE